MTDISRSRASGVRPRIPLPAPRRLERTGDDRPAGSLFGYVRRMTGWHQICACLIAALVAGISILPIELQRRIVDDAIRPGDVDLLLVLCAIYVGALAAERLGRFVLQLYQGWLAESAIHYTRRHLARLYCERVSTGGERDDGRAVTVIGPETEALGNFAGDGPSRAASNLAMLLGVGAYMLFVAPMIAAVAFAFLLPQVLLTPLIQRRLNALSEERLERTRALANEIADEIAEGVGRTGPCILGIYRTRMRIHLWKALLKALLNLLNHAGPLLVLGFGGWLAIRGETTVGTIVAFVSAFERLSSPIRELISVYRQAAQANVQHALIARWM